MNASGRRVLAIGGLAVLVLALLWLARPQDRGSPEVAGPSPAASPVPARATVTPAALDAASELRVADVAPRPVETPSEAAPEPAIDREELRALRIRVTEGRDAPIARATVSVTGFRSAAEPGSWHGWRWDTVRVETDSDGTAQIDHHVWSQSMQGAWIALSTLILQVEHPSYQTASVEAAVGDEEVHVVLELGSVLVVSGWIGSPDAFVLDVRPTLCYDARVDFGDWVPLRDGRLSCNKIPAGRHVIRLRAERDGVGYASDGTEFELLPDDQQELCLELHPPRTLRGELDPAVPRPIEHGQVRAAVQSGARERGAVLAEYFAADVDAQGAFELTGLPPGETEVIGLCDGWTSVSLPPAEGSSSPGPQLVPEDLKGVFVLRMEPAASLALTVLAPDGAPLSGARVQANPNVHWATGFSQMFVHTDSWEEWGRRRWVTATDEQGVAQLANLPPTKGEYLLVSHSGCQMPVVSGPWGRDARGLWVDLVSGETTRAELRLEAAEDR